MKATKTEVSRANELNRSGAQAAGSRRTSAFYKKWQCAMAVIEQEVISNKGAYPQNDGKLNLTELARRAGCIVNSLFPARHSEFKIEVGEFIDRMLSLAPVHEHSDAPPAPTWESLYLATVANYQADALLWRSDRARREAAEQQVEELEQIKADHLATIERLTQKLTELTRGRVVPISSKKEVH